mmetsp:Transcript_4525/g.10545  ORF Transcript_4525/g.10545 Transcript_4525/m.10545 type:complete len:109 (+) Transcript_4525:3-329(+)
MSHEERVAARRAKKTGRRKAVEQRVEKGEMSLAGMRERSEKLGEKNKAAKEEKASKGTVREQRKRLRASELLEKAAESAGGHASRREEKRTERQQRPDGTPSSKRLKL